MDWGAIIAVIAAISGIVLGWLGRARTVKADELRHTEQFVEMQGDFRCIRDTVESLRSVTSSLDKQVAQLNASVVRLEEKAKTISHRVNTIEDSNNCGKG